MRQGSAGTTTANAGTTALSGSATTTAATTTAATETTAATDITATTTTPATIVCPEGWIDASVSDLGCLYFAEAGLSWFDTQSVCEGYQGFSAEALTMSQVK